LIRTIAQQGAEAYFRALIANLRAERSEPVNEGLRMCPSAGLARERDLA
jgi:hypothetical protein